MVRQKGRRRHFDADWSAPLAISCRTQKVMYPLCRPEAFGPQPDGRWDTTLLNMRVQRAYAYAQQACDFGGREVHVSFGVAGDGLHGSVASHDLARHPVVNVPYKTYSLMPCLFEATACDMVIHAKDGAGWNFLTFGPIHFHQLVHHSHCGVEASA